MWVKYLWRARRLVTMSHIGEAFCILSLLTKMDKLGKTVSWKAFPLTQPSHVKSNPHLQNHTRQSLGYVSDKSFNNMATFGVKHTDDECPIFYFIFLSVYIMSAKQALQIIWFYYILMSMLLILFLNHLYIEIFQHFV